MKKYLKHLPQDLAGIVAAAEKLSRDYGYKTYLVGGLVRDLILGAPNFDLDIVVTALSWDGEAPPEVGQDIEGSLWLQGYLKEVCVLEDTGGAMDAQSSQENP